MTANAKNTQQELPLVLSVARAAREYGFDSGTLMEAIREGRLRASRPTARTIRVFRRDIEEWMADHAVVRERSDPKRPQEGQDNVVQKRLHHERRRRLRLRKRASTS